VAVLCVGKLYISEVQVLGVVKPGNEFPSLCMCVCNFRDYYAQGGDPTPALKAIYGDRKVINLL
jgi:hypothetical protein